MSDNWGYDQNNLATPDPSDMNGPEPLRKAYRAQKEQNDELRAQFAALQAEVKAQKVQSIFNELGVPAAASQYQGDAEPEKIKEWVTTMQSVFGGSGAPAPIAATPTTPPVTLEGDMAAQLAAMQNAGTQGQPLGNAEAAFGRVNDATDIQGLINAFKPMG
jgi:hypothetical protein